VLPRNRLTVASTCRWLRGSEHSTDFGPGAENAVTTVK
jgi:hypothetical protein